MLSWLWKRSKRRRGPGMQRGAERRKRKRERRYRGREQGRAGGRVCVMPHESRLYL
jgi:hypothetical protein